ncbi:hypothetical protein [Nocardia gipuzkoensis]|uniref:hypothetical protein n=1 Tax=Nocardia gipuzkoensis TaxID=2749991 RepID=UPI003EE0B15A
MFGGGDAAGGLAFKFGDFAVDCGGVGEVCEQVAHVGSDGGEFGAELAVAVQQRRQGGLAVGDRPQRGLSQVELVGFAVKVSVAQSFLVRCVRGCRSSGVGRRAGRARGRAAACAAGELAQACGRVDRRIGDGFQHLSSVPIHSISFRPMGPE